ncbi:WD40 repeat-containing protein [Cryptosporidium ubiquitum]|uniref:WD40 repeat-containing protein n=1 Tax=Cryptosporidium ubiquitum TaxID=857276 RepID=A0A1J4MHC5_9CRYT|nr:WD40 repeat-containing protein [Cryptosporidium ubiquitum]OII73616.1 WD40 repeat-containing protein [Cryptosporidium ubiquitum]
MKIHLTSDEINLLVYRYLIENGFVHTAFSFNSEANVPKNPFFTTQMERVPPNALVGFLQKALLYIYLEYHTSDETGEEIRCEEPFSIFKRHECWCRPLEQIGSNTEITEAQPSCSNLESTGGVEENMGVDASSSIADKNTTAVEDLVDTTVQPPTKKSRKSRSISSNLALDSVVQTNTLEVQHTLDETLMPNKDVPESFQDNLIKTGSTVASKYGSAVKARTDGEAKDNQNLPVSIKGEDPNDIESKQIKSEKSSITMVDDSSEVAMEEKNIGSDKVNITDINTNINGDCLNTVDRQTAGSVTLPLSDKFLSDIPHFKLFRKGDCSNGIREVQFSKRQEFPNKLVITWEEGCPELWEIDPNSQKRDLESSIMLPVSEGGNMIAGTVVTMSNDYIVIGYENGRVTLFSYSGKELTTIRSSHDQESPIVSLKLSGSSEYLAIGDATGNVMVLRISFEESLGCYKTQIINEHQHNSAIFGLCWCSNDSFLLSGCLDRQITVLDIRNNMVKSFSQEGPILSINQVSQESPFVTCMLEGVSTIPVLKISRDDDDINLQCTAKISIDNDHLGLKEDGQNTQTSSQINFIESNIMDGEVFHIVATPYNIYLFDKLCNLLSCQKITNKESEPKEIVSICVDNKSKTILVGINDGSVTLLELSSLDIKSKFLEKNSLMKPISSTGVGLVSINSSGNLIFVGGPNLPAIYIFGY